MLVLTWCDCGVLVEFDPVEQHLVLAAEILLHQCLGILRHDDPALDVAGELAKRTVEVAVTGAVAGGLFVLMFTLTQNRWKIDDVLGVWPLHGLCGAWGGLAAGIFGQQALGGLGGVSFSAQLAGTALGVAWALIGGWVVYGGLRWICGGLKLDAEQEFMGADLSLHKIGATPDRESDW